MYEKLKELLSDESRCSEIILHTSGLRNKEFTLDLNSEEEWVRDVIFIFDCFRKLTIEEFVSLVNEQNYNVIIRYWSEKLNTQFLNLVGSALYLSDVVGKIEQVIMLSKTKIRVTKLLEVFRNNKLEYFLLKLSSDNRYGYRNAMLLYNHRNPNQTLYTEDELKQIIEIIKIVDNESKDKRLSPFELAQSSFYQFEHILPGNLSFNRFKSLMTSNLHCLNFLSIDLESIDIMLEFFVIMDVCEIAAFISLDEYGNQKILFECLRKRAHELGKIDLVNKIDCLLQLFKERINRPLYNLIDAYRTEKIVIFLFGLSLDELIGLKNTILLYDYHNPGHILFTKDELEIIVEIIMKNIRENFPDYSTPLELSQNAQKREAILTQKLPKGRDWIDFSSSVFGRFVTICDKKYKTDKDNYYLDTILEFLVILNIDEIVEFMLVYNNYCVDSIFNVLKKRALELGHKELADKIEQSLKQFSFNFDYTIRFYMDKLRSGELGEFVKTIPLADKKNLIYFFRLYNSKIPNNSAFSQDELTEFIKIIGETLHVQESDNEALGEKSQLMQTSKSVVKPKNLLGIYNLKMIKEILNNSYGIFSSDREEDIILDFFEIMSVEEIAELIPEKSYSTGHRVIEAESFRELRERAITNKKHEIVTKIDNAIEKAKVRIASNSPDGNNLSLERYLSMRYPNNIRLSEHQQHNDYYNSCHSLSMFKKMTISNSSYDDLALVVFDALINSDSDYDIICLLSAIPTYIKKNYKIEGIPIAYFAQNIKVFEQLIEDGFDAGEKIPAQVTMDDIYKQIEDTMKARGYKIIKRPCFKLCKEA